MDNYDLRYGEDRYSAAAAPVSARAAFIRRTYAHLAGAIAALVVIEAGLFASGVADQLMAKLFSIPFAMLGLMLAFVAGGFVAQMMARSRASAGVQYLGLIGYVLLEAAILLPLLWYADQRFPGQMLPAKAAVVTLMAFAGLTAAVFISGKDFSFLGPVLWVAALGALGVVVASIFMGFTLGIVWAYLMVVLACGFIVYDTSNVIHHHRTDEHVAASLELFASVALMFWYVLRIFMLSGRND
jgi:FtsH-binding integral membrane protein